jgi:hypothetical protein
VRYASALGKAAVTYHVLGVRLVTRLHKGKFFLPVDEGADTSDNHDCDEDGGTLNPG